MNITIRKAELEDASCIVEAERKIAQTPGFFCSQPAELNEQAVKQTIQSPQNIYLVAEYDGQVVAHAFLESCTLQSLRHVADLNIAVHLDWQGKGIGKKLLEQIIKSARSTSTGDRDGNLEALHRTTIVIAHRLSTLSRMDRILVFNKEKIVEEGTHAALMSKDGLYAKMWNKQVGGVLPEAPV